VHACTLFYYSVTCYGCHCSLANLALPDAKYFLLKFWHKPFLYGLLDHSMYLMNFSCLLFITASVDAFEPLLSTVFWSSSAGYFEEIYSHLVLWLCPLVLVYNPPHLHTHLKHKKSMHCTAIRTSFEFTNLKAQIESGMSRLLSNAHLFG
jgi:hypothetical protein